MSDLISAIRADLPDNLDVCVSLVLFRTAIAEVERAIAQALRTDRRVHVVVIDNTIPALDLDGLRGARVTIVAAGANLGYGRGHNLALEASRGKCRYHLVMNTDLEFTSDVIAGLAAFMDDHPDVGLAMPRIVYPDGSLQRLCRLLPDPVDLLGRRFFKTTRWAKERNRRYEFHGWSYDTVAEFPFLSGCFMFLRRSTLDAVGHFDERFFLFAEDLDLSRRINAVARTLYVPKHSVTHEYRSQARPSLSRLRMAIASLTRYFFKWGWIVDPARDAANRKALRQFE